MGKEILISGYVWKWDDGASSGENKLDKFSLGQVECYHKLL